MRLDPIIALAIAFLMAAIPEIVRPPEKFLRKCAAYGIKGGRCWRGRSER